MLEPMSSSGASEVRNTSVDGDQLQPTWTVSVDGASNSRGNSAGVVLASPEGVVHEHSIRLNFNASNNETEYEDLLAGLELAKILGAEDLSVISDSHLIVNQVNGEFECRDDRMGKYMEQVREILARFGSVKISQVGREQNAHADALDGLASATEVPEFRTISIE